MSKSGIFFVLMIILITLGMVILSYQDDRGLSAFESFDRTKSSLFRKDMR